MDLFRSDELMHVWDQDYAMAPSTCDTNWSDVLGAETPESMLMDINDVYDTPQTCATEHWPRDSFESEHTAQEIVQTNDNSNQWNYYSSSSESSFTNSTDSEVEDAPVKIEAKMPQQPQQGYWPVYYQNVQPQQQMYHYQHQQQYTVENQNHANFPFVNIGNLPPLPDVPTSCTNNNATVQLPSHPPSSPPAYEDYIDDEDDDEDFQDDTDAYATGTQASYVEYTAPVAADDPVDFKLPASKTPIMEAMVVCALNNWGLSVVKSTPSEVIFCVTDFDRYVTLKVSNFCLPALYRYYRVSRTICSKHRPTEDIGSRVKSLRRWFTNFPKKRDRQENPSFLLNVKPNTCKKVHGLIERNGKLLNAKRKGR